MTIPSIIIEDLVRAALKEDLGHGHDITSQSVIGGGDTTRAVFNAREEGVLAGLVLALSTFSHIDPDFEFEIFASDGDIIGEGQEIAAITGSAASILTRRYVLAVQGTNTKITDTRKTLPFLRTVQKYAVRAGGGYNHRFGLDDCILIKDNHIAIAGGIDAVLNRARDNIGHTVKVEIEVDTLQQLEQVLRHGGADIVMLDNFPIDDLCAAIKMVNRKIITETSGGVNLHTVREIAETGVDYISIGALTHSAPAMDIGLDIEI